MLMFVIIMTIIVSKVSMEKHQRDPATDYILYVKNRTNSPKLVITTSNGASVSYTDATTTLNMPLINNEYFMESLNHIVQEKIPERIVHAKGTGAFGYFKVTHNISHICKASFLKKVGEKTPVAVRFSTSAGERGSSELVRGFRGLAVKFYTEEGNFDLTTLNTPVFSSNDPIIFSTLTHASNRNPATNLFDRKTFWDVLTLFPESLHMFMYVYMDSGIPASYRHMRSYGIHSYQVENKYGDNHLVKFHLTPDAGIKSFGSEEARNISATDPDYMTRDLFRAIGNGNFPSWTLSVQILTEADVEKLGSKAIDVTRVIPLSDFPLHQVGKLVLNRNPKNQFAEMEQLAFCPASLVCGILGGPDKLFQARRMSYRNAQNHRLGVNKNNIPINCPYRVKTFTYTRDGTAPVNANEEDNINYYPNSFNGPEPKKEKRKSYLFDIKEEKADNRDQISDLYAHKLKEDERTRLITNLVSDLKMVNECIQERVIKVFTSINSDLGKRLEQELNCKK